MAMPSRASLLRCAAWAALLIGGCDDAAGRGGPSAGPSGGKADDAEGEGEEEGDSEEKLAFVEAVGRCEKLAERGRKTIAEARVEERLVVESDRLTCLREATDDTLAPIEATLESVESEVAGDGEEAFTAWRETNADFCHLLVTASAFAVEKNAEVHEAACVARAELQLAEAIVAFADLGGSPTDAPEARVAYVECYDAFDAAIEAAQAAEAMAVPEEQLPSTLESTITAHRDLATCIQTATTELDDELATRVTESFPGRGMDNLQETIADDFEDTAAAAESVCNVLGSASIDAGDPEAELQAASCIVAASIWRAKLIGSVIPELAPAEEEDSEEPAEEPGP